MTTSIFQHAKRGSMTAQRALKVFERRGGRCYCPSNSAEREFYGCKRPLYPKDDWRVDHIIALENGGTDDDDNLQILCEWHHKQKTGDDHAQAGHGRRAAAKTFVPSKFKKSKGWGR